MTYKDIFTFLIFICASLLIGTVGWSGNPHLMPISLLILPLWYYAPNRITGLFVYFAYSIAASYSLPAGTINYSGFALLKSISIWLSGCIIPSIPFLIFHFQKRKTRLIGIYIALFLISIPPFALTCWSHPIMNIGIWWPGGGWIALLITLIFLPLVLKYPIILSIPIIVGLLHTPTTLTLKNWKGINTNFKGSTTVRNFKSASLNDFAFDYYRQSKEIKNINSKRKNIIALLPESSGGTWSAGNKNLWKSRLKPTRTALVNASIQRPDKTKDSVIIGINTKETKTIYLQRQPVPYTMWNPFKEYSFNAHWFDNPVVDFHDERVAFFVCYEQFLMWPMLHSFASNPTVLCAVNNVWWAKNGNIPAIQHNIMYSWSRLFNMPLVTATNI